MPKYLIRTSAYVRGVHYSADHRHPREITLPADVEPATSWDPMDKAAQDALHALAKKKLEALPEEARKKIPKAELDKRLALKPIVGAVPTPPPQPLTANGLPKNRKAHLVANQGAAPASAPPAEQPKDDGEL